VLPPTLVLPLCGTESGRARGSERASISGSQTLSVTHRTAGGSSDIDGCRISLMPFFDGVDVDSCIRLSGFGYPVSGFGFRVSGFGFRAWDLRVSGDGFRVSGFGFRVLSFGFRVSGFSFGI